jgi:formylglycine-generating enzyme required for sulfatase activity
MALVCPNCTSIVPLKAEGCAGCGAVFQQIRCLACRYVDRRERFQQAVCPRCSADDLAIVPGKGEAIEQVGAEAFVKEPSLADEIERRFSQPGQQQPRSGQPKSSGEKPIPGKPAQPPAQQPSQPRTEARRADEPRSKARRDQTVQGEAETAPDRTDRRRPLKRRAWNEEPEQPAETETPRDLPQPDAAPIAVKRGRTFSPQWPTIHLAGSSIDWKKLRPVLLVLGGLVLAVVIIYFLPDSRPQYHAKGPATQAPANGPPLIADPAVLEAEAARLFQAAVEYYRTKQPDQAVAALRDVVERFPQTVAAGQARQALNRQGGSLFAGILDEPPETSTPQPTSDTPEAEKKKTVIGIPASRPGKPKPASVETSPASTEPRPPHQGSTLARSDTKPHTLPPGFIAIEDAGVHGSGWPIEIIGLKDQSHMMLVPEGEFEMGDADELNTQPVHRVKLKAFYIDKFEITLGRYKHFLEQRRLESNAYRDLSPSVLAAATSDRHPVVGMAWRDANAYAHWAGKTLPSEAQWEKAARGTDGRVHPWGAGAPVWQRPREPKQIDRVGSFAWDVSPYGCYDMAANVWEWCADWYDPKYYASSPAADPSGPSTSLPPLAHSEPERTLRSGSPIWRVTWRSPGGINDELLHVGFRCALQVEISTARQSVVSDARRAAPKQTPTPVRAPPPGGFQF